MSNKINTLIKELNNLNIYNELLDIEQAIDLRDRLNFIINKYSKFFCIDSDSECENASPSSIIRSSPVLINNKNTDHENNYDSQDYEEDELKTPTYDQNYNQSQNVNYSQNYNQNLNYSDYLNYNHNNFLDNTSYYYQNQNQNQHQNQHQYTTTNIPKSQEEKNLRHTEQYV